MNRYCSRYNIKILSILLAVVVIFSSAATFAAETVVYYHTDPAGTPLAMTDSRGNVIWKADYRPFGEEQSVTGTAENNRKFVGKEKDTESGLSYFGARYLKSDVGRFISPDPVGAVDPITGKENSVILHNPQRLNQYAYGLNNPYRYVDADGRIAWFIPPLIAAGSAFGYNMFSPSTANAPGLGESTIASQTTGEFLVDVAMMETGGRAIAYAGGKLLQSLRLGGLLRDAAQGKGNFGLGTATRQEAELMGQAWVGEGYTVASNGTTLVSADGLRIFRPPSAKPNSPYTTTGVQANFEQKMTRGGRPYSNGHLDILD
jgi:RHS repeat-associated protein